jgi:hypothetical protein
LPGFPAKGAPRPTLERARDIADDAVEEGAEAGHGPYLQRPHRLEEAARIGCRDEVFPVNPVKRWERTVTNSTLSMATMADAR